MITEMKVWYNVVLPHRAGLAAVVGCRVDNGFKLRSSPVSLADFGVMGVELAGSDRNVTLAE